MTDWAATYEPLIGRKVEVLKWRPMTSDTPGLVADFRSPSFSFTGAVQVFFEGSRHMFLTWRQVGTNMVLMSADESDWRPHSLDCVRIDQNEPWGNVEGSILTGVRLFSMPEIDDHRVLAVRHELRTEDDPLFLWVGVGVADAICDTDDLWVGAGIEPPNLQQLIETGRLGR